MPMISIRKYLNGSSKGAPDERWEPLFDLASRLLAGIEAHGINHDYPEGVKFQEQVRALHAALDQDPGPEKFESVGAEVGRILEKHERWCRELSRAQAAEVQNMVAMLNRTVAVLSSGSERSVSRLRRIEGEIQHVAAINDLVALKARLADCLAYVQEETAREREEVARTLAGMEAELEKARETEAMARSGLPGRAEAEQAIARAAEARAGLALVCVLDRFENVQARFGPAAADQFVDLFVRDLGRRLPSPKKLFRWSAVALVALLEPTPEGGDVPAQIRHAMQNLPLERKLETGGRVALIAQPVRWTVLDVGELPSAEVVLAHTRQFTGETS